ncbi:MAG: AIPR family protein [Chloroflexi bacterium]|nr:AIPR family protein [Chloroflexota bacterium]
MPAIVFKPDYSRQYPDPLNKASGSVPIHIEHHIFTLNASQLPEGIPKSPNPREQNTNKSIYKDIRASLDDADDPTFHLKNIGITAIAQRVEYSANKDTATVLFEDGQGILNGAHTYEIIQESIADGDCPDNQFVKMEILTGIPPELIPDLAGGLNTSVQVDPASIMNLEGLFEWVKEELKGTPYEDRISYKQNEEGDFHVREILALMTLFNVDLIPYPLQPKEAYTSKAKCLELYKANTESFMMLRPILRDILQLYDYVQLSSRTAYNKSSGGKAGAMTGVFASKGDKTRSMFKFIFAGEESKFKLYDGALYPMLGSMRYLVEKKPGDNVYSWKVDSFQEVKNHFDKVAPELTRITYNMSLTYGRKPNPIGKDDNHWGNLYKEVAMEFLEPSSP